ncbi:unnamed protein product [Soboliphyme baturini]|uniref:Coiled-coil domain-containing protein 58 n=1 Tax=Soboliphyme baturini TaxID=241478 RepID=A0A183J1Z6_9BILA|nr:unnamed protein product [Soboliphyme baturini]
MFYTVGKVEMEKVPSADFPGALRNLLSECASVIQNLEDDSRTSKNECFRFQTERDEAVQLYRDLVEEKAALEDSLISRFACVLNAKKEKLVELQQRRMYYTLPKLKYRKNNRFFV